MPLLTAIRAAMDNVRASRVFAPLENNDVPEATEPLRRYYENVISITGKQQ